MVRHKTSVSSVSRKYSSATSNSGSNKVSANRKCSTIGHHAKASRKQSGPQDKSGEAHRKQSKQSSIRSQSAPNDNSSINSTSTPCCQSLTFYFLDIGQESGSIYEFISHCFTSIFSHRFLSGIYISIIIFSSLSVYFGLLYINKCPIKDQIPLYLLIFGALAILQTSLLFYPHIQGLIRHSYNMNQEQTLFRRGYRTIRIYGNRKTVEYEKDTSDNRKL
uniref:Uncharacterized protein n=1 Tax=Rhabditophanes sp. KR3021 TaxID=114890 RepID=A0AC35TSV1_9BILA